MLKYTYMQDRLNAMILTPEEVEAFKAQRELYAKNNMSLAAQEKLEAAREASVNLLKALFVQESYEAPKIDERALVSFGLLDKPVKNFGTKCQSSNG